MFYNDEFSTYMCCHYIDLYHGFLGTEERLRDDGFTLNRTFYWLERINVTDYYSRLTAVPVMTSPIHCDIDYGEPDLYLKVIEFLAHYGPVAVVAPVGNALYLTSGGLAIFQPKDGVQKIYRNFEYLFYNTFDDYPRNRIRETYFIQATSENLSEMFDVDMLYKAFETLAGYTEELFELFGNLTGHFESYMKRVHTEEYAKTPHLYRFLHREYFSFELVSYARRDIIRFDMIDYTRSLFEKIREIENEKNLKIFY